MKTFTSFTHSVEKFGGFGSNMIQTLHKIGSETKESCLYRRCGNILSVYVCELYDIYITPELDLYHKNELLCKIGGSQDQILRDIVTNVAAIHMIREFKSVNTNWETLFKQYTPELFV